MAALRRSSSLMIDMVRSSRHDGDHRLLTANPTLGFRPRAEGPLVGPNPATGLVPSGPRPLARGRRPEEAGSMGLIEPDPPLDDGAVLLRAWRDSDVEAMTAACQDPAIRRFIAIPWPYDRSDAVAYID